MQCVQAPNAGTSGHESRLRESDSCSGARAPTTSWRNRARDRYQYYQQLAARQLGGQLGQAVRSVLCGTCAAQLIDAHLASGVPGAGPAEGASIWRRTRASREPIFVGLLAEIERGPQGRIQPTCMIRVDAAVDPATLLQAGPKLHPEDAPTMVRMKAPNSTTGKKPDTR